MDIKKELVDEISQLDIKQEEWVWLKICILSLTIQIINSALGTNLTYANFGI